MANVINGGAHSDAPIDFQEFMVQPHGFNTFSEGLQAITEIFHALKSVLKKRGLSTAVGDEGGFAPKLNSVEDAIESILEATKNAGYKAGKQIYLALDVAASEFYNHDGTYTFKKSTGKTVSGVELVDFYAKLVREVSDRQHRRRLRRRRLEALEATHRQDRRQGPARRRRSVRHQREVPPEGH
jgi:enolase